MLYILDEPSIGLHQRDNQRLLATLKRLRDLGNTVLVVEHDRDTMLEADHLIDMGPGAGVHGGHLVAQGTPEEVMRNAASLTGRYLKGELEIATPRRRRQLSGRALTIKGAKENNLRDLTSSFPLGVFICVTGVSGSGKSSLVLDTLYRALAQKLNGSRERAGAHERIEGVEHLDKVIHVDQSPIGRTPRSNPATYTGLFTHIRELFAQLPEARDARLRAGALFVQRQGRTLRGVPGRRHDPDRDALPARRLRDLRSLRRQALQPRDAGDPVQGQEHRRRARYDVSTSARLLRDDAAARAASSRPCATSASTTSARPARDHALGRRSPAHQARPELSRRATGRTLYILDEPTTGLHFDGHRRLLEVLQRLVDNGNTVLVIEHNLDVIKTADYVIDLGPEGGDRGGQIVAKGTPEEIAAAANSHTGQFLRQVLGHRAAA